MDWITNHWQETLAILGVLVASFSSILYIRTILSGESKPHRVTWGGWTLVGTLGILSSWQGGAGIGLIVALAFAVGVAAIFALSLFPKYGKPGGNRLEYIAGAIAAVGILTQLFINYSPVVGATIAVLADLVFLWPTLKAAWVQPDTEALYPWVIGAFGEALGIAALGNYSYAASVYSIYVLLGNAAVITALLIQKPKHHKTAKKKR